MDITLATTALQHLSTGVLIVNQRGDIIFCNHWLHNHCSLSSDAMEDEKIEKLFPRFREARIKNALSDAMQYGISSTLSYSIHKNIFPLSKVDGETIDHTVTIQGLPNREEEDDQLALIQITDVSSSTKRERWLRKAQHNAEEANLAKDEFLAAMSHELRTPLTTIIGNSELLAEQEHDFYKQELIHSIEIAGRSQLALVNDVLDMSKIEAGKFAINDLPYNLSSLLRDLEYLFSTRAKDSGIAFHVQQEQPEDYLLLGDGQRIGQILINLLSNAFKFTEEGAITLSTITTEHHLIFKVEDTGIGMSTQILDNLFQRFEQADQSISRRFGGTGLGLFISEKLATLMDGTIDVSSKEGVGSIFELVLPYRKSPIPATHANVRSSDAQPKVQLSGHILVAEDTLEIQQLERRILESMGLSVTTANNGQEAIDYATANNFDLILMDMQMPELDGIEATRTLRATGNSTPVVALTANVLPKHRESFKQAGCNGFLSKPIDKHELQHMLQQHLPQSPESSSTASSRHEAINETLMELFINGCRKNRSALQEALSTGDLDSIYNTAHKIKGSAQSFGHAELGEAGKKICELINNGEDDKVIEQVEALISMLVTTIHVSTGPV